MKHLNKLQQQLLWFLVREYIAVREKKKRLTVAVDLDLVEKVVASGLCDLFDIEFGYCNDDFIHDVMTVRIGRAWSNTKMSKEMADDDAMLSHIIDEVTQRVIHSGIQRGIKLEFDFVHIDYDAERRYIEITTFFKIKK